MEMEIENVIEDTNNMTKEFHSLETCNPEFMKKCNQVARDIESRRLPLAKFVEDLSILLVNKSPSKREHGVSILAKVVGSLPFDFLSADETDYIAKFFADRFKDHNQVIPAVLQGVWTVFKFSNVSAVAVESVLNSMQHNVPCQQQQQSDRKVIFSIFQVLLDKHHAVMRGLSFLFVQCVVNAMDGERDPRNLLELFKWLPDFYKRIPISDSFIEDAFEVLACYFPVDFKAPPQDPNAISREELADALCRCLCATSSFGDNCLSLAKEKMPSSMQIAKLDSLKLIEHGCQTFDTAVYFAHSRELWNLLKDELFNNKDPKVESACRSTLQAVVNKLSQPNSEDFKSFLLDVGLSIKRYLLPNSGHFTAATQISLVIGRASPESCAFVTEQVVPLLTNTYNMCIKVEEKTLILHALADHLVCFHHQNPQVNITNNEHLSPILVIFLKETENPNLSATVYHALGKIAYLLPETLRFPLYTKLTVDLVRQTSPSSLKCALIYCFENLSKCYPQEITVNVMSNITLTQTENHDLYLEAVCSAASQPTLSETVISMLLAYAIQKDINIAKSAIKSLASLTEKENTNKDVQSIMVKMNVINNLISWLADNYCGEMAASDKETLLCNICLIIKCIMGYQSKDIQSDLYQTEMKHISCFSIQRDVYIPLLSALNMRLLADVRPHYEIIDELLKEVAMSSQSANVTLVTELIANLLNKCQNDSLLGSYLHKVDKLCEEGIKKEDEAVSNVISLLVWTVKALLQRNHPESSLWLEKLLNLLDDHMEAAASFKILMDDSSDSLNRRSYCNTSVLYRQKVFTLTIKRLKVLYEERRKPAYLVAFGYLWCNVPLPVVSLHFKDISRLTLLCLDECREWEVLYAIFCLLKQLIMESRSLILEHFDDFLQRVLLLCELQLSMKVRVAALQCLQQLTYGYPLHKLLPHKQAALDVLERCIDDRKRIVRQEAALTRALWFLIDAET